MKQSLRFLLTILGSAILCVSAYAQVTTSSLNGRIVDESGDPLAGAAIIAVHTPSGTQYSAIANGEGRYTINGMRAGGPYKVSISFLGMGTIEYTDVVLKLGEPFVIDSKMSSANELEALVFTAEGSFKSHQTGAGANFSLSQVENVPTIDRNIYDVIKFTPQVSVNKDGGVSIAGSNNRYNSFQIDGAIANDSFGLSSSGTNGGQTGANPVSIDAIEEIQVVVAPFDVRQSGFTGGAINAITKSGTNTVKGSAYAYFYNQDFVGTTPGEIEAGKKREKYDTQNNQTYGFTIGAPIIKNKLFIFASGEYYRQSYPSVYYPGCDSFLKAKQKLKAPVEIDGVQHEYFDAEVAAAMIEKYKTTYGNGLKGFSENFDRHQVTSSSINALLRLDWNINDRNKLMLRYQFMKADKDRYSSGAATYYFNNSSFLQSNLTNTVVAELNSRISDMVSNEFRATAVFVRDHRTPGYQGANMYIKDNVYVNLGTEYSSGVNYMHSDNYTLTDNVSIFVGNHTITAGTHNELFKFSNAFLQYAFGGYTFNTVADFFDDKVNIYNYKYADPTMPGVTSSTWAATTYAAQFGLYVQDEWKPSNEFTLTYGLRADIPTLLNKPSVNEEFNATEIAQREKEFVGTTPKASVLFSPRVGFRWYIDKSHASLLRGGAGLFTGRVPFVWLSNAYNNTGVESKSIQVSNNAAALAAIPFTSDPYNDVVLSGAASAGGKALINTLSKNFKYPQVFRVSLGFEHDFGQGWSITLDALYSKTLNNVYFKNLALSPSDKQVFAAGAEVAASNPASTASYYNINKDYAAIVALQNTNKGFTYSLSAQVDKHFDFGLDLMASYAFGHSYSVNDGSSSVALSNWQNYVARNCQTADLSYSVFDKPHRVMGVISYTSPTYARVMKTTVSLSYEGFSGNRYTYIVKENVDTNGDEYTSKGTLVYVPTKDELVKMSFETPQDALAFEKFIREDRYLSKHRGQFTERFGGLYPFEHHFNLHVAQDFFYDKKHGRKIQVVVDFMNISNLFNRNWGLSYSTSRTRQILECSSVSKDADGNVTPTYKFSGKDVTYSDFASRWKCQLGLRVTF